MTLDIVHPARPLPRDLVASQINPTTPNRPVQPFAHPLETAHLPELVNRDTGPRSLQPRYTNGLDGEDYAHTDQLLLIRP